MIDVTEAAKKAIEFIKEFYAVQGHNLCAVALEEIKLDEKEMYWLVTVGFQAFGSYKEVSTGRGNLFAMNQASLARLPRSLKMIKVNATTGEIKPEVLDRELSPI